MYSCTLVLIVVCSVRTTFDIIYINTTWAYKTTNGINARELEKHYRIPCQFFGYYQPQVICHTARTYPAAQSLSQALKVGHSVSLCVCVSRRLPIHVYPQAYYIRIPTRINIT